MTDGLNSISSGQTRGQSIYILLLHNLVEASFDLLRYLLCCRVNLQARPLAQSQHRPSCSGLIKSYAREPGQFTYNLGIGRIGSMFHLGYWGARMRLCRIWCAAFQQLLQVVRMPHASCLLLFTNSEHGLISLHFVHVRSSAGGAPGSCPPNRSLRFLSLTTASL